MVREVEAKEAERKKRGQMTGREIFQQEGFIAADDASASESYAREVDDESEIQKMHERAREDMEMMKNASVSKEAVNEAEESGIFDSDDDDDDVLDALTAGIERTRVSWSWIVCINNDYKFCNTAANVICCWAAPITL